MKFQDATRVSDVRDLQICYTFDFELIFVILPIQKSFTVAKFPMTPSNYLRHCDLRGLG